MACLTFGEILWDVIEGKDHLGGAPLNVAIHLAQLGLGDVCILSAVGRDPRGEKALAEIRERGVATDRVHTHDDYPTGHVSVELGTSGDASYTIHEQVAWDAIPTPAEALPKLKVLYFGSLAQRTEINRAALDTAYRQGEPRQVFFDVNLRQHYYSRDIIETGLKRCTILKANHDEIAALSPLVFNETLATPAFVDRVRSQFNIAQVLVTEGSKGARVFHADGEASRSPGTAKVVDTVGAGDSLSAGYIYGIVQGYTPAGALDVGMKLADQVVRHPGAQPRIDPATVLPS